MEKSPEIFIFQVYKNLIMTPTWIIDRNYRVVSLLRRKLIVDKSVYMYTFSPVSERT